MKRLLQKLTLIVVVLALLLSVSACSFVKAKETGGNTEITSTTTLWELPNSIESVSSKNISVKSSEQTEELSKKEVVSLVSRACVSISVVNTSGTGSTGSGVIIDIDDGINESGVFYVLTCHHVIDTATTITVYVPDNNDRNFTDADYNKAYTFKGVIGGAINKTLPVSLVGGDPVADVGLLRLYVSDATVASNIVKAKVIDPDKRSLSKGEDVIAIGNPSGELPGTVLVGCVSYLQRFTLFDIGYAWTNQIDTQIHPGSSGGGLFNMYGELVGITNGGNTKYDGLNYALCYKTSDVVGQDKGFINVASQLLATYIGSNGANYGYVSGRWLAGMTTTLTNTLDGVETEDFLLITEIIEGSNAEKAGLKVGDRVVSITFKFEGSDVTEEVSNNGELSQYFSIIKSSYNYGESFVIKVHRGGADISITVTIVVMGYIFQDTGVYVD